jgi:acyl-CoA synthetase (AMP-forming)/AMP-acid ligase II
VNSAWESNFAARLVRRLSPESHLTDAATGVRISSDEITELIVGAAADFLSAGLPAGERILISCALSPASTLAYLGAIYAGLVPVPIEGRTFQSSGYSVCLKARAKAVWTENEAVCPWARTVGVVHFQGLSRTRSFATLAPIPRAENDLAALMPTSGSTGTPRLVKVTHANLTANTEAIIRSQSLGTHESAMLILPLSYCFGASVVHSHLYQGGGVVYDSRFMFPDKVLRAIHTNACTTFAGVPTVYNILASRSSLRSIPLPGLRRFLQAGGSLAPETLKTIREIIPGARFFAMYGQTEATARISCLPPDRLDDKLGSAGILLDNLEMSIVDQQGLEVPQGHVGEIWVKGPSICAGYFEDPEETSRKFEEGWLKTGDLGCLDEDQFLWIKGRKSDFMKIRGVRVSVSEVESCVGVTPGVFECAAASVPHPEAGEALVLFVVPEQGVTDLPERVRQALPPHWTCVAIHLMEALPKTSNGKIARAFLKPPV